jgi:hypothetical protein
MGSCRLRVHEEPLAEFLICEKLPQRTLYSVLSHGGPPSLLEIPCSHGASAAPELAKS